MMSMLFLYNEVYQDIFEIEKIAFSLSNYLFYLIKDQLTLNKYYIQVVKDIEKLRSLPSIQQPVFKTSTNHARLPTNMRILAISTHTIRISQVKRTKPIPSRIQAVNLPVPNRSVLLDAHSRAQLVLLGIDHEMDQ